MAPRRLSVARAIAVLALALVAAACGSSGASDTKTSRVAGAPTASGGHGSPGQKGALIITRNGALVEFDIASGSEKPLITPQVEGTFLLDPAVSPDGQRLAYVSQPPPTQVNGTYDSGADVWVANRDGSDAHVLFTHERPNQLLRFPGWQDDANVLAIVQEPATSGPPTGVEYVLERIPADGSARTRLLSGALGFGVSPDRLRVAYAMLPKQSGEALVASNLDGSAAVTLVGADQNLAPFNSPRYSPDGASVAFASADQTGASADRQYVSLRLVDDGSTAARLASASTDGLPEDIWIVGAGGGTARRIANLKEDLPTIAFNGDGSHLYALGANGLSDINVATGAVTRIAEGAFHGQIAFAP